MQTVAVTGGSGRIGGAVIRHLNDREYTIVNLCREDNTSHSIISLPAPDRSLS